MSLSRSLTLAILALSALAPTAYARGGSACYRAVGARQNDHHASKRSRKALRYTVPHIAGSVALVDKNRRCMVEIVRRGRRVITSWHPADWIGHAKAGQAHERVFSSEDSARRAVDKLIAAREKAGFQRAVRDNAFGAQAERRVKALKRELESRGAGTVKEVGRGERGLIYRIDLKPLAPAKIRRKHRGKRRLKVLISTWIHGDESAGPEAAIKMLEHFVRDNETLRERFDLSVLVKMDSSGRRDNASGQNVNRGFESDGVQAVEVLKRATKGDEPDLFIDLHAAELEFLRVKAGQMPQTPKAKHGFFLIESSYAGNRRLPDDLAGKALAALPTQMLLDTSARSRRVGPYAMRGLGNAVVDFVSGTFMRYAAHKLGARSFTLEAPKALAPKKQVAGTLRLLRSLMEHAYRAQVRNLHHARPATLRQLAEGL